MDKGNMKVKKPKSILLFRCLLNSFISNSKPAINMIYSSPIVENKSTALFFAKRLKPNGPITTPEMINPMIPGICSLRRNMGAKSIINKINEKIRTGFFNGNTNSCPKCAINSFILNVFN